MTHAHFHCVFPRIGESLREVALRNGCCMADDFLPPEVQDEAPSAPAPPMATGDLRVVLTSAMTGAGRSMGFGF